MHMKELENKRQIIDAIDKKIIKLAAKRLHTADKIAEIKKQANLKVRDSAREKEVKNKWIKNAKKQGLDKKFALIILSVLLDESIEKQKRICND